MPSHPDITERLLIDLIKQADYEQVIKLIEQVPVKSRFTSEPLLFLYAVAQRALGKPEIAVDHYKCALRLNPNNAGTWSNLGNALKDMNLPYSSVQAHKKALDLSAAPDATLLHNYGISLAIAGDHTAAESVFLDALLVDPSRLAIKWDLARAQLAQKNYREGFINYQFRWASQEAPARRVNGKEWHGEHTDKPVFVYCEQGFGDFIQCVRFLKTLRERVGRVVVEVKPELKRLVQNSFSDMSFVDYRPGPFEVNEGLVVSIVDLPRFCLENDALSGQSYLSARQTPELENRIQKALSIRQGLNIGVIWSGSLTFKRNHFRSAPTKFFNRLAAPGINLYSLQLGARQADTRSLPISFISDALLSEISDFNDTAAIVQQLDLVVMTCSSTAHLCGALGVPCWVLLDTAPHWLWGVDVADSDWYESIRLFRQHEPEGWSDVFDRVATALSDMITPP